MSNVVRTSLGRILNLPVETSDIRVGEIIEATNAPNGRLYTMKNEKGTEILYDASVLKEDDDLINGTPICIPIIEIEDLDNELNSLNFMDQLSKLSEDNDIE